jgi:hypothetical protein
MQEKRPSRDARRPFRGSVTSLQITGLQATGTRYDGQPRRRWLYFSFPSLGHVEKTGAGCAVAVPSGRALDVCVFDGRPFRRAGTRQLRSAKIFAPLEPPPSRLA